MESLDRYVLGQSLPMQDVNRYRTSLTALQAINSQRRFCYSSFVRTPVFRQQHRTTSREWVRQLLMNWRRCKINHRTKEQSCGKRKRQVTSKSLMEEPERKLQKIADYWVVRPMNPNDDSDMGQRNNEMVTLDWCQYELERSLWPQRCGKRNRKTTMESLREEPKKKAQRVREYLTPFDEALLPPRCYKWYRKQNTSRSRWDMLKLA